jgi:hypothetical protein
VGLILETFSSDLLIDAQHAVDELLSEQKIPLKLKVETLAEAPDLTDHVTIRFSNGRTVTVLLKAGTGFKERVRDAVLVRFLQRLD